jgi:uncharacterized membrane protein
MQPSVRHRAQVRKPRPGRSKARAIHLRAEADNGGFASMRRFGANKLYEPNRRRLCQSRQKQCELSLGHGKTRA